MTEVKDGKVFDATTFVADVHFQIHTHQNYIESSTLNGYSLVPGMKRLELQILGFSQPLPIGQVLTLHFNGTDEKLRFFMSGARAVASGAIYH